MNEVYFRQLGPYNTEQPDRYRHTSKNTDTVAHRDRQTDRQRRVKHFVVFAVTTICGE